jgi:hypothetical protein
VRGIVAGSVLVACAQGTDPRLRDVTPAWAWEGERPLLAIAGSGLRPSTRVDVAGRRATQDASFAGALGGRSFGRLDLVSASELRGTTPAGLSVGPHDLSITTPDGERLGLADAFEVVALDGGVPPSDGGPGADAGTGWLAEPPDWRRLAECGNESCDGPVAGCADAGECPPCPEGDVVWRAFGCDWSMEGTHFRQWADNAIGCDALLSGLDAADVQVEADVEIPAIGADPPHQVGVLLRASDACVAENRFYACLLEVDDAAAPSLLRLVAYDGEGFQNFAWEAPVGGLPVDLPVAEPYTIRARAIGGSLACELCADQGCSEIAASATGEDARFAAGTVGLRTYRARAMFRDVEVWVP